MLHAPDASAAMPAPAGRFVLRPRPGAAATLLVLGPEALVLDAPAAVYPYRDIVAVTLLVDPNARRSGRFRARLDMTNGDGLELASAGYDAAGAEIDLSEPYAGFVRALCGRVAEAGGTPRFTGAARPLDHLFNMVTGGVTLAVMSGGAAVLLFAGYYAVGGLLAGFSGLFAPFVANYLKATRTRPFDPRAVPAGLLPGAGVRVVADDGAAPG